MANLDWTKVVATVFGALILALQGTNVFQGVAISGAESRIERIEEDLAKANLELNKSIVANQEDFRKYLPILDAMAKKLDSLSTPTPTPNQ